VEPYIDGVNVSYLGSVGPAQRAEILGGAAALLHPIAFAEPFGLSVVESMACGTPVIAYPLGSMPEVIDVGVTGYLAADVAAAAAAVPAALALDRQVVRRTAERRFSSARMVDDYLTLYQRLLAS
jgi:glycosyltransferase involved in cell wall biosynthesis